MVISNTASATALGPQEIQPIESLSGQDHSSNIAVDLGRSTQASRAYIKASLATVPKPYMNAVPSQTRIESITETLSQLRSRIERSKKERNIKAGQLIPGTDNIRMAAKTTSLFRLFNVKVHQSVSQATEFKLTFGRLRHICTGTNRISLIARHTPSQSLDHWVNAIFDGVEKNTQPWLFQTNEERSAQYLTSFRKSEATGYWIAEKVVTTLSDVPDIITAYPILDLQKIKADVKRFPVQGFGGLSGLPNSLKKVVTQALPKEETPQTLGSTGKSVPSAISVDYQSGLELQIPTHESSVKPVFDIKSSDADELLILQWTQMVDQINTQVGLLEEVGDSLTESFRGIFTRFLTSEEQAQYPDLSKSRAIDFAMKLFEYGYFKHAEIIPGNILLMNEDIETLEASFADKKNLKALRREFPNINLSSLVKDWRHKVDVAFVNAHHQSTVLLVSLNKFIRAVLPKMSDMNQLCLETLELRRSDDTFLGMRDGRFGNHNINAKNIYDVALKMNLKLDEVLDIFELDTLKTDFKDLRADNYGPKMNFLGKYIDFIQFVDRSFGVMPDAKGKRDALFKQDPSLKLEFEEFSNLKEDITVSFAKLIDVYNKCQMLGTRMITGGSLARH